MDFFGIFIIFNDFVVSYVLGIFVVNAILLIDVFAFVLTRRTNAVVVLALGTILICLIFIYTVESIIYDNMLVAVKVTVMVFVYLSLFLAIRCLLWTPYCWSSLYLSTIILVPIVANSI